MKFHKIMTTVDIKGINKVKLLKALWSNMKPAAFFYMSGIPSPSFDDTDAGSAVKKYIDYFCGRNIKCDLSGNTVDPSGYDRDAGNGAFQKIVNSL